MDEVTLRLKLYKDTVNVYIGDLGERVICENTLGQQKEISLPKTEGRWWVVYYDEEYVFLGEEKV